jgi:hypothetical protein
MAFWSATNPEQWGTNFTKHLMRLTQNCVLEGIRKIDLKIGAANIASGMYVNQTTTTPKCGLPSGSVEFFNVRNSLELFLKSVRVGFSDLSVTAIIYGHYMCTYYGKHILAVAERGVIAFLDLYALVTSGLFGKPLSRRGRTRCLRNS